jgi:hypothetical protein
VDETSAIYKEFSDENKDRSKKFMPDRLATF